jgi:hypothetical protein
MIRIGANIQWQRKFVGNTIAPTSAALQRRLNVVGSGQTFFGDWLIESLLVDNTEWVDEAEVYRIKGELLLKQHVPDTAEAEQCFQLALLLGAARSHEPESPMAAAGKARRRARYLCPYMAGSQRDSMPPTCKMPACSRTACPDRCSPRQPGAVRPFFPST